MKLSPRYSLLTLLVLTALVAGGVKLWYGPHHVVERSKDMNEDEVEYTFTRDWRGERIIHGPYVRRSYSSNKLNGILISYYQDGKLLEIEYSIWVRRLHNEFPHHLPAVITNAQFPSTFERERFYELIRHEEQKVTAQGL